MIRCKNACLTSAFDGCCVDCPTALECCERCAEDPNKCGDSCFDEKSAMMAFQTTQIATLNAIASLIAHKKVVEDQEKEMKAQLYEAMTKYGVEKFESDVLNLTLVKPSESTSIDSTKLKKKYPDIAEECSKVTQRAGYVKVTVKANGN